MKIRKWLELNKYNITTFSKALDIDRAYLHMIIKGTRIPGRKLRRRLTELTRGEIKIPEDLVDFLPSNEKNNIS